MERYFRFIYHRAYAASQMRVKYLYELSKEEFFITSPKNILNLYNGPSLFNRFYLRVHLNT
jgi:hypothetical protein